VPFHDFQRLGAEAVRIRLHSPFAQSRPRAAHGQILDAFEQAFQGGRRQDAGCAAADIDGIESIGPESIGETIGPRKSRLHEFLLEALG
jgi:hypothetical protein